LAYPMPRCGRAYRAAACPTLTQLLVQLARLDPLSPAWDRQ
jgi:hypothetical protein